MKQTFCRACTFMVSIHSEAQQTIDLYDITSSKYKPSAKQKKYWMKRNGSFFDIQKSPTKLKIYLPEAKSATGKQRNYLPVADMAWKVLSWKVSKLPKLVLKKGVAAFVLQIPFAMISIYDPIKSIGPLQDHRQAMKIVRQRAQNGTWMRENRMYGVFGRWHLSVTWEHIVRPSPIFPIWRVLSLTAAKFYDFILSRIKVREEAAWPTKVPRKFTWKSAYRGTNLQFSNELHVNAKNPAHLVTHDWWWNRCSRENSIRFSRLIRHGVSLQKCNLYPKAIMVLF